MLSQAAPSPGTWESRCRGQGARDDGKQLHEPGAAESGKQQRRQAKGTKRREERCQTQGVTRLEGEGRQ